MDEFRWRLGHAYRHVAQCDIGRSHEISEGGFVRTEPPSVVFMSSCLVLGLPQLRFLLVDE